MFLDSSLVLKCIHNLRILVLFLNLPLLNILDLGSHNLHLLLNLHSKARVQVSKCPLVRSQGLASQFSSHSQDFSKDPHSSQGLDFKMLVFNLLSQDSNLLSQDSNPKAQDSKEVLLLVTIDYSFSSHFYHSFISILHEFREFGFFFSHFIINLWIYRKYK